MSLRIKIKAMREVKGGDLGVNSCATIYTKRLVEVLKVLNVHKIKIQRDATFILYFVILRVTCVWPSAATLKM